MNQLLYKQLLGSRILSEANDLKRTTATLASELGLEETYINQIIRGESDLEDSLALIRRMGNKYPIDWSQMLLIEDDCSHGVKIMRKNESEKSSRIFDRKDKTGNHAPYYEYRDTAMSRLGPFRPEWIREIRLVNDSNPQNPDVIYNNGHLLNQATFFIGPVNFYWQVAGIKYCREMNTGDSNFITPYWPHSFANREEGKLALIIAVTFIGDAWRAQKEFYALGKKSLANYRLDYRNYNKATSQLIAKQLQNACLTADLLKEQAKRRGLDLNVDKLFDETAEKSLKDLSALAECLTIEVSDLMLPRYKASDEVLIKPKNETDSYAFPSESSPKYVISPFAMTSKMPGFRGFNLAVQQQILQTPDYELVTGLHSYLFHHGDTPTVLFWRDDTGSYQETILPGDSVYIQPFVEHSFANQTAQANSQLCVFRVSGSINLSVQKELSYYSDADRIIKETKCWFDQ